MHKSGEIKEQAQQATCIKVVSIKILVKETETQITDTLQTEKLLRKLSF